MARPHDSATRFDVPALGRELARLTAARRFLVAYSGGLDSHVLLHALSALAGREALAVRAIHVDHALVPESRQWLEHCRGVCAALGCALSERRVSVALDAGLGLEQAARRARYAAFAAELREGEELLTAHTGDDQAETLLLRLLRGAGVEGAAGMPGRRRLGAGWVTRPLLAFERDDLTAYARRHRLRWVEDPGNRDTRHDRNFLRHRVLPLLRERWPGASATLARGAAHFAVGAALLEAQARVDAEACRRGEGLASAALGELVPERQDLVLRLWLRERGALAPSAAQLAGIRDLLRARADRVPRLRWGRWVVRRYRGVLHLATDPTPVACEPACLRWDLRDPLSIPGRARPLTRAELAACGLTLPAGRAVEVRFRRGGERIRLAGRGCTKTLKKLFQEAGIAPWERARVPLIYVDGELAAVVGIGVSQAFAAGACAES